jgi:hypothetical protein
MPQDCVALPLHGHIPAVQVTPVAQAFPQPPQFALSVCRFAPPLHAPQLTDPSALQVPVCVPVLQVPQDFGVGDVQVQTPFWHPTPCAQRWSQPPQLAASDCSSTQALPHSEKPLLHEQPPHAQAVLQDCDPLPSQASVVDGAHAPAACEHVDHADHVPSALQVRFWEPQLPQDCVVGPVQVHFPAAQVPLAHFMPQAPQSFASVVVSTQAAAQAV